MMIVVQYNVGQVAKKDIFDLYNYIKKFHEMVGDTSMDFREKYQHKCLLPSLRNYQAHAVHWMIARETECHYETGIYFIVYICIRNLPGYLNQYDMRYNQCFFQVLTRKYKQERME